MRIIFLWFLALGVSAQQVTIIQQPSTAISPGYQAILNQGITLGCALPNATTQSAQNLLYNTLNSKGILTKLDVLYVKGATGSSRFTDINWVSPGTFTSTENKTPTFNWGVNGTSYNGVDQYTDTGFSPSSGTNFSLTSCESMIAYVGTIPATYSVNFPNGAQNSAGNANTISFNPANAANTVSLSSNTQAASVSINNAAFALPLTNPIYLWGRNGTQEFASVNNGGRINVGSTNTATNRSTFNFTLGGYNQGGTVSPFNTLSVGVFASGALLTTQNETDFYTAVQAYISTTQSMVQLPTIGSIYNKNTWTTMADFTVNGATASIVSNKISISNGAGNFTHTVDNNVYVTKLAKWTQTIIGSWTNTGGSTFGDGVGIRSNQVGSPVDLYVTVSPSTSGKILAYVGPSHTNIVTSATGMTINANDNVSLTVSLIDNVLTASAINTTTGGTPSSITFTFTSTGGSQLLPNTGKFCLVSLGETAANSFNVSSWSISSTEYYQPKILFVGDSKWQGYYASKFYTSCIPLFGINYGPVVNLSGNGDETADYVNRVNEITNLIKPKIVVISGASNDPRRSRSASVTNTNYDNFVSSLTGAGIVVYHTTGFYENSGVDQTPLRTHIIATYPTGNIIDTLGTTITLNADNIHPDNAGHASINMMLLAGGIPIPIY